MSARNFDHALSLTLSFEGGYADHPADPGGATNMGITRATLARVRGRPVTKVEVAALTRTEAADIYRRDYWDAVSADHLPDGVDLVMFDHAVNSGAGTAMRTLRQVLGLRSGMKLSDPAFAAKIQQTSPAALVAQLCAARRSFLSRLKTFRIFGAGWMARVARLEREAIALATGKSPTPTPSKAAQKRPNKEKLMPSNNIREPKPFWASQTIWSSVAVIGSSATGAMIAWTANDMAGFGASLTALFGGVNAVVGRFRADGPIL